VRPSATPLNACQSGAAGKQLEAAVATRLLQGRVAPVVAMACSVYAVAAAQFMAAFYERLFRHPGRPSPKGDLPLAGWVVARAGVRARSLLAVVEEPTAGDY